MKKHPLKRSNILLISPKFFNYDQIIIKALSSLGAKVDFYDNRFSSCFIVKVLLRVAPILLEPLNRKYYKSICKMNGQCDYDYVLLIKGEGISNFSFNLLKSTFSQATFVFYAWDSLENYKFDYKILNKFDVAYSFDRRDCNQFQKLIYKPLFYHLEAEEKIACFDVKKEGLKFLFIGTVHSDRWMVLNKITESIKQEDITAVLDYYLFYPSKFIFFIKKIFDKNMAMFPMSEVNWTPLTPLQTQKKISGADFIIDVNHPKQHGLTIRTIEALGLNKKLITTNSEISKESFFSDSNILIVNRENPVVPARFLQKPFDYSVNQKINSLQLENWIIDLLRSADFENEN